MAVFKAFKPSGMEKIARSMGYQGDMSSFQDFLAQDPKRQQKMNDFTMKAQQMAKGGIVKMQEGGDTQPTNSPSTKPLEQQYVPQSNPAETQPIGDETVNRAFAPELSPGTTVVPVGTNITADQDISGNTGQLTGDVDVNPALANTNLVNQPNVTDPNLMNPDLASDKVNNALDSVNAAQTDPNDPRAKIIAASETESSVGNLDAAQGKAHILENPMQRTAKW